MAEPGEPERFDAFMERCLYGPEGFYATTGSAGRRRGDFLTSPEVGPLFGAVLTRSLVAVWEGLGRPDPFTVYDVGAGPGTLLRTVSVALDDLGRDGTVGSLGQRPPWRLVGVDRVPSDGADRSVLPDELGPDRHGEDELGPCVVVANELLDNLPIRIVEGTDGADGPGLAEVFVASGEGGDPVDPVEVLRPSELAPVGPLALAPGRRAPVLERAAAWVADLVERSPAAIVLVDYGAPTTAELVERGGWLRTYRDHHRGSDPLAAPGSSDITTDVAWDQLPTPDRLETQADFLRRWGIDELVEEGRRVWHERAAAPDVAALRMRSRVVEAEALTDPDGLGGWWVASWSNLGDSSPLGLKDDYG